MKSGYLFRLVFELLNIDLPLPHLEPIFGSFSSALFEDTVENDEEDDDEEDDDEEDTSNAASSSRVNGVPSGGGITGVVGVPSGALVAVPPKR